MRDYGGGEGKLRGLDIKFGGLSTSIIDILGIDNS
jgi:hypothetical protein